MDRPCVILKPAQELFRFLKRAFGFRHEDIIIAGSCATAQALMNELGQTTPMNDIDMFVADNSLTLQEVEEMLLSFAEETKYHCTVKHRDFSADSQSKHELYKRIRVVQTFDIELFESPLHKYRIGVPVQLISVDASWQRPPGSHPESLCFEILSRFDISICKIAILDPEDMTVLHYHSQAVRTDIRNGTMGYDMHQYRNCEGQHRLYKYMKRGWDLNRLQIGPQRCIEFDDAIWSSCERVACRKAKPSPVIRGEPDREHLPSRYLTLAPSSTHCRDTRDCELRCDPCRKCLFHPLVQDLYRYLYGAFQEQGAGIVLAGSSALAQKIMNDTGNLLQFNDVDLFSDNTKMTYPDLKKIVRAFETRYGCTATVSSPSYTAPDNDLYEYTKIHLVADITLETNLTVGSRVDLPVQLIVVDLSWDRVDESPMQPLEQEILSRFDLSVCRCAVSDPFDMTSVYCTGCAEEDIALGTMEYDMRWFGSGKITERRVNKYVERGWVLRRIRLDSETVFAVQNVRFSDVAPRIDESVCSESERPTKKIRWLSCVNPGGGKNKPLRCGTGHTGT